LALRFLGLSLATWIIFYGIGASSVGTFLPQEFAVAAVFLRLQREMAAESPPVPPLESEPERDLRQKLATA
jgi:hypothetical protein